MDEFTKINKITVRPGADSGLWALFLLPLSVIISTIKHSIIATPTYKLASLVCMGMMLTSVIISMQKWKNQKLKVINIWIVLASLFTTSLCLLCLHKGFVFSLLSGLWSTLIFMVIYKYILRKFKECFTLGEAGIVSQGIVILIYFTIMNVLNHSTRSTPFKSNMQISTLIIQIGMLGIAVIAYTSHSFNIRGTKSFYFLAIAVIFILIFLPLHLLLKCSPVLWIINQMIDDWSSLKLIMFWIFCSVVAVLAISKQILYAQKSSTTTRKVFHLLAVVVYIPGLIYKCSFLYLASGVVTGIFFALEILRLLQMPPLGTHLQEGFVVFSDEKDGNVALTPIYLLAGCSLPIWIHPSPCDVTNSATFTLLPLLSGLLAIGVGDTAASVVGSNFGRHFWPGTKKTIEGTAACIISQVGLIFIILYFGFLPDLVPETSFRILLAIITSSIVEAKTTQVDNLVLPLIMYIILI
ncbi:unnamed protein product [Phaedon cochleariae]|uniref:dolichol kinase n=1 Tax=Phaedon cochleariae TaxID=80249 RepID=A0A9P0GPL6_PHACE|nr:unnamed protein product [Phaedon cochleariae]